MSDDLNAHQRYNQTVKLFGAEAEPVDTSTVNDCASYSSNSNELCQVTAGEGDTTLYVAVHAWRGGGPVAGGSVYNPDSGRRGGSGRGGSREEDFGDFSSAYESRSRRDDSPPRRGRSRSRSPRRR